MIHCMVEMMVKMSYTRVVDKSDMACTLGKLGQHFCTNFVVRIPG